MNQTSESPKFGTLQYYLRYLQNYLANHDFSAYEVCSPVVTENALDAADTYARMSESGYDGIGANELAFQSLFSGIGASHSEVLGDILWNRFYNTFNVEDGSGSMLYYWTQLFIRKYPAIFEGLECEGGLGLDESDPDTRDETITSRIIEWCAEHDWNYYPPTDEYKPEPR